MEPMETVNVWKALYHQTPLPIRFILGGLMAVLAWMSANMWRAHQKNTDRVERELQERIARETERIERQAHERIDEEMRIVHNKLDQIYGLVVGIAQNTSRRRTDSEPQEFTGDGGGRR